MSGQVIHQAAGVAARQFLLAGGPISPESAQDCFFLFLRTAVVFVGGRQRKSKSFLMAAHQNGTGHELSPAGDGPEALVVKIIGDSLPANLFQSLPRYFGFFRLKIAQRHLEAIGPDFLGGVRPRHPAKVVRLTP